MQATDGMVWEGDAKIAHIMTKNDDGTTSDWTTLYYLDMKGTGHPLWMSKDWLSQHGQRVRVIVRLPEEDR